MAGQQAQRATAKLSPRRSKDSSTQKRVLFLGYTREQTSLIDTLIKSNCEVRHVGDKLNDLSGYDLVVSFGYRHILSRKTLDTAS